MKIPTLLALTIFLIIFALGAIITFYFQKLYSNGNTEGKTPQNIQAANITDKTATIIWYTKDPTNSELIFGTDENFDSLSLKQKEIPVAIDDRDRPNKALRISHYVTLTELKPQTHYYFKIKIGNNTFSNKVSDFTTGPTLTAENSSTVTHSLIGSIKDNNLNPVSDALVTVSSPNFASLATFTSESGNFVLPLKNLRTPSLDQSVSIDQNTEGTMIINKGGTQSTINVLLFTQNRPLPEIVLGQNLDLRDYFLLPTPKPSATPTPTPQPTNFDLNNDKKVNSLDVRLVSQWVGKKAPREKDTKNYASYKSADLNGDGIVDKKDVDLIKANLSQ